MVVAGLPAVGKNSLAQPVARTLGLALFEIDRIEAPLLQRGISGDAIGWAGYEILTSLAEDNLALGHGVLLDSVCWTRDVRRRWAALADQHHAAYRPIEVICSDVELHRSRVSSRRRGAQGFGDIDWRRVVEARSLYEPWDRPHLELDSARPLDDLVREAVAYGS